MNSRAISTPSPNTGFDASAFPHIRSLIEPLLIYHQVGSYGEIRGSAFRSRIIYWRDLSIDSTLYALDSLHELGRLTELKEITERYRPELIRFVIRNFENQGSDVGGFRQSSSAPASVYATSMAFKILRYLSDSTDPYYEEALKPLGYKKALILQREFEKIDPSAKNFVEKSVAFALRSIDSATGGFFDSPQDQAEQRVDITTTHAGYLLLWNLERSDATKSRIVQFLLEGCVQNNGTWTAFGNYLHGAPGITPTFYGLRLLENIGMVKWINEHKSKITEFLEACWEERICDGHVIGSFKMAPDLPATLVSTSHAIQILLDVIKDPKLLEKDGRLEKVLAYFECSRSRLGGFSFQADYVHSRFVGEYKLFGPNLYMTRHAIRCLKLIQKYWPDRQASVERLLDARLYSFITDKNLRRERWAFSAYGWNESSPFIIFLKGTLDFLLAPNKTLKYPLIRETPIYYYFLLLVCLLVISIIFILNRNNVLMFSDALVLSIGPLIAGIFSLVHISIWAIRK